MTDEKRAVERWENEGGKRLAEAPTVRVAKRCVVAVIGGSVTLIGIALIVLPGRRS
jgi:hypothetical protein